MFTQSTLVELTSKHRDALASSMELDATVFEQSETRVITEAARSGSGLAVAYFVGSQTVVRADPALGVALVPLANSSSALSAEEFRSWGEAMGWRFLDGGDHHLVSRSGLRVRPLPSGVELRRFDREDQADRHQIAALLARNDPEDVDEAEFDLDDLDPFILGLVDRSGQLQSMVSGREWEDDSDFDDIGVLTDHTLRGRGWGGGIVASFCLASFERGRIPLYRCNWSRTASKALAEGLGFELVCRLSAMGPPSGTV